MTPRAAVLVAPAFPTASAAASTMPVAMRPPQKRSCAPGLALLLPATRSTCCARGTLSLDLRPSTWQTPPIRFYRLDILDTQGGGLMDSSGVVEFEAFYKGAAVGSQRERSSFRRFDGTWVYSTGEL